MKPAETDKQKQKRLRKWRREISADTLLRLSMEEMRTCQCEHIASKITDDKDVRVQQLDALQHKLKG